MSNLLQKTELLLHILQKLPNSDGVCDVEIEGFGPGIDFSWSLAHEGIPKARFRAENRGLQVQVVEMVEDPHQTEEEPTRPHVARKTALAFFVGQTINMRSEPVNQMATSNPWPSDLINAAALARAMHTDVETRLRNNESIDMLHVLDRFIELLEAFEL